MKTLYEQQACLPAVLFVFLVLADTQANAQGVELHLDREEFPHEASQPCSKLTCRVEGHSATLLEVKLARIKVNGITDNLLTLNLTTPEAEVETTGIRVNGVLRYNRASVRVDVLESSNCESDMFTCEVSYRKHSGEMESAFTSAGPRRAGDFLVGGGNQTRELDTPSSCEPGMANDSTRRYHHYVIVTQSDIDREVLCDTQTDGGGWIVIQRRVNGDVDFYRNWTDYKDGFGDLEGDFWLGNQAIAILTNTNPYKLRIDLHVDDRELYAEYSSFRIENEYNKYRLRLGPYSGTMGEYDEYAGMTFHNNQAFSTYDSDNDAYSSGDCADMYRGGWWYRDCYGANLNGLWGVRDSQGVRWFDSRDLFDPTFVEMKIRRV